MSQYPNKTIELRNVVVKPGENRLIRFFIDRLPTGTEISIPIYVFNGKEAGPTILLQGGLHGDEINSTELLRRMLVDDYFDVKKGTVIVVPLLNVFGFIHFSREVHGKDVNRKFPGTKSGSLASRMAYYHMKEIVSQIDFGIDCHTGGGQRSNYPQIRYTEGFEESEKLARIFNAPFLFPTALIDKSFRKEAYELGVPIIVYEGGESLRLDEFAINEGIRGILNVLKAYDVIDNIPPERKKYKQSVQLHSRKWIRAETSGIFDPTVTDGDRIKKGQIMGSITDTYGETNLDVKAPFSGYVIGINNFPVVNLGDPLFHIGKKVIVKKKVAIS